MKVIQRGRNGSRTIPQLIEKTYDVLVKMTANENFKNPKPKLNDIQKAVFELEMSYVGKPKRDAYQKSLTRLRKAELETMLCALEAFVIQKSKGDKLKIMSAGFEVK